MYPEPAETASKAKRPKPAGVVYEWCDVANRGRLMVPQAAKWHLCDDVFPDRSSGFMKCSWTTPFETTWVSEVTIQQYNQVPQPVMKRPAGSNPPSSTPMKAMKASKASDTRKKEYSRTYHQKLKQCRDAGMDDDKAKDLARKAARKHVESFPY